MPSVESAPSPTVPDLPSLLARRLIVVTGKGGTGKTSVVAALGLAAARAVDSARTDFARGFDWPARGRISGVFGSQRVLNGQPRQPHYGFDIAAPTGTPVLAAASGRVTLADEFFFFGKLLVIDHGHGVNTLYAHLSALHATEGKEVAQGERVAAVVDGSGLREALRRESTAEAESRLENLDELVAAAEEFAARPEGGDLGEFLDSVALIADVDELEEARPAVTTALPLARLPRTSAARAPDRLRTLSEAISAPWRAISENAALRSSTSTPIACRSRTTAETPST